MQLRVRVGDDGVGDSVMYWIRRSRVRPRVVGTWKSSVELSCLAWNEDHGLVTVAEEVLDSELVELWRHR